MRIGERRLLPAVRAAGDDALVVADGFACREQIAHGSGRRALHPAEVVQLALCQRTAAAGTPRAWQARTVPPARVPAAALTAGMALAAGAMWWWTRRRQEPE
jgi:hypothetical protein